MERNGMSIPSVQHLESLLNYQDNAVVSRTLVKNAGGNLTLFAFDTDEGLSEHTAPFEAWVYGVAGEADITIDGEVYRVHTGETITLPANRPHAVRAVTPFKMLLVMIRAEIK
jgi:quercetin dioxygenase-like cupin family protein